MKLAESQGVRGERVQKGQDLHACLRRGLKATNDGRPFLVEVLVECVKNDAEDDPEWHDSFSLALNRRRGRKA